jgi:IS5 family transposase
MRPPLWHPPIPLSRKEQTIVSKVRRAKLFVFLRRIRHELFDDAFQEELATIFEDRPKGQPPIPPAKLALATILQAYTGVSDDEAIEALVMDRRWQLVLDCLDCERAPFGKGTLVRFRQALIAHTLDRRLIERTVELAEREGDFGPRQLRAALDSSPLWGAGRVEDTYNLLGHALRKALSVIARQQGRELAAVAREAEAELLAGSSLKAALDLNWDDPAERGEALGVVLSTLEAVERFLAQGPVGSDQPVVSESLAIAHQVRDQDVEVLPENVIQLRHGVAKERRISVEDGQMRHGRKSRSQRVDGYKRHILRDLDNKLVRVVGLTPANVPEAAVTDALEEDLAAQGAQLSELHIDRAYLSSRLVRERSDELAIYCKAWPVRNGDRFPKTAFALDFEQGSIRCPNQVSIPFQVGTVVHFPEEHCAVCPLQLQCTSSPHGRSVSIHPDEPLLAELRQRQQTTAGRAKLRERVAVEHGLAHVGHWQGDRARYRGLRKNLFDLRRVAVVHNLHVLARLMAGQQVVAA